MKRLWAGLLLSLLLAQAAGAQAALTPGFDVFRLGMTLGELKDALRNNSYFLYNGEPDVTMLSRPNTNLIDVPGISYFSRGIFQVVEGKLYSITLELNVEQLSYFAMYQALTKKYGEPAALDPSSARWESAAVRLSLEKPLTVKYLDMPLYQRLQKEGAAEKALETLTREKFLENF